MGGYVDNVSVGDVGTASADGDNTFGDSYLYQGGARNYYSVGVGGYTSRQALSNNKMLIVAAVVVVYLIVKNRD